MEAYVKVNKRKIYARIIKMLLKILGGYCFSEK